MFVIRQNCFKFKDFLLIDVIFVTVNPPNTRTNTTQCRGFCGEIVVGQGEIRKFYDEDYNRDGFTLDIQRTKC